MEAGANTQRTKRIVADRDQQQPGPAEEPGNKGERQQQMKADNGQRVGPNDPATVCRLGAANRVP